MTQIEFFRPNTQLASISSETHCFGIFKPDAIEQGIVPDIKRRIGDFGLQIIRNQFAELTPEEVLVVWPAIVTPHASRTIPYMTSAPVELFVVEGLHDVSQLMLSIKQDVRRQHPNPNPVISVMHTTDHDEELRRCHQYFFEGEDL